MTPDDIARLKVTAEGVRMARGWTIELADGSEVDITLELLPADVRELCAAVPALLARIEKLDELRKGLEGLRLGARNTGCQGEPHRSCGLDPCVCR